jgi:hypothetical protein
MTNSRPENNTEEKLFTGILRLNSKILGLVLGLMLGLTVFIMTNWLVIKGGPVGPGGERIVGPHLKLLAQFFIGYRVSFAGSIIGFAYGFALGSIGGSLMGWIYNRIADFRNS